MGPEMIRAIKLAEKRSEHMPITTNRRVQLDQAWELRQRFHLSRLEHYAMVLQVPFKKAERLPAMAGIGICRKTKEYVEKTSMPERPVKLIRQSRSAQNELIG